MPFTVTSDPPEREGACLRRASTALWPLPASFSSRSSTLPRSLRSLRRAEALPLPDCRSARSSSRSSSTSRRSPSWVRRLTAVVHRLLICVWISVRAWEAVSR